MGEGSVSVRIGIVEWLGAWAWPSGMCRAKFGGPEGLVGKLVKLFGETRTVTRRWRNKGEAAFFGAGDSLGAVEGQMGLGTAWVLCRGRRSPQTGTEGVGAHR